MRINEIEELNEFDLRSAASSVATGIGKAASGVGRAVGTAVSAPDNIRSYLQSRAERKKYFKVKKYALRLAKTRWQEVTRIKGAELQEKTEYYNTLLRFLITQFHLNEQADGPKLIKIFRGQDISNDIVQQAFSAAFDIMYVDMNYITPQRIQKQSTSAPTPAQPSTNPSPPIVDPDLTNLHNDVLSALKNLGVDPVKAQNSLGQITDAKMPVQNAIKVALKSIGTP